MHRRLRLVCISASIVSLSAIAACSANNDSLKGNGSGGSSPDIPPSNGTGGILNTASGGAGGRPGSVLTGSGGITGPVGSGGGTARGGSSANGGTGTNAFGGSSARGGAASGGSTAIGAGGFGASNGGSATGGTSTPGAGGSRPNGGSGNGNGGTTGSTGPLPLSPLGSGVMEGMGSSMEQYQTVPVSRDGTPYDLITNGWGPGWRSHTIAWNGTSFTVQSMQGTKGSRGEPASYPSVFCGRYSVKEVPDCGLPATISSIKTLRTGWRWAANGNSGEYNAAYDIWIGDGNQLKGYLMVWLRDPPQNTPAGSPNNSFRGITVANVPGTWDIWNGSVNGLPITNYVRPQGSESSEIEFDVMDVIKDAQSRNVMVPGDHVNAVAVGFEIWEGPIMNLQTVDFYVRVN
jgi:hypothetical protein